MTAFFQFFIEFEAQEDRYNRNCACHNAQKYSHMHPTRVCQHYSKEFFNSLRTHHCDKVHNFQVLPILETCGKGYIGWFWRNTSLLDIKEIRQVLAYYEKQAQQTYPQQARNLTFLLEPDIGECYPDCDRLTDEST